MAKARPGRKNLRFVAKTREGGNRLLGGSCVKRASRKRSKNGGFRFRVRAQLALELRIAGQTQESDDIGYYTRELERFGIKVNQKRAGRRTILRGTGGMGRCRIELSPKYDADIDCMVE